jgi:beta-galactosidase
LQYLPEAHRYHRALRALGVTVDFVAPEQSLDGYDLVIVPTLYLVTDLAAAIIAAAAEAGATVLVTPFSGIVDDTDAIRLGGYPGAFRDLLGITVDEFRPLAADHSVRLTSGGTGSIWSELVVVIDADTVDEYADGPATGSPAVTHRRVGSGHAWYVSTMLDDAALAVLMRRLCGEADVPVIEVGHDVDVVTRSTDSHTATFVINHRSEPITVELDGLDVITGETVAGATLLAAGAVRVVFAERSTRGD